MSRIFLLVPLIFILLLSGTACDPLAKLAKSGDVARKDSVAVAYYKKEKFENALLLLEELLGVYRGTPRAKDIYYMYAYSKYEIGEHVSAAFYFEDWARQYPRDEKVEEMRYMQAYCFYLISDPWYLDQSYTTKALETTQLFLQTFPYSDYKEKAEEIITELRERQARKAFEQAKLYHKIGYHRAAIVALDQLTKEYPDSKFREECHYLIIKSGNSYAKQSVADKKIMRYEEAIGYYEKFVDKYPNSKFVKEAENLLANSIKNKEKLIREEAQATARAEKKVSKTESKEKSTE